MEITAAVRSAPKQPMTLETLQLDEPSELEMIVKITSSGVCHTDIGMADFFPAPSVLGHEGCGVVEKIGAQVTRHSVGDRVALTFGSCGSCPNCISEQPAYCYHAPEHNFSGFNAAGKTTMRTLDGQAIHGSFFTQSSFASHALVTERNAVAMPEHQDHRLMGPLGCGIQTGAGAVLNVLQIEPGSSFVCFGVGAVGMSSIMAAVLAGATTIIAVDLHQHRLTLAEELGATHTFLASETVADDILKLTDGGVDYSFDTAGTLTTLHQTIGSLHPGGHGSIAVVPDWFKPVQFDAAMLMQGKTLTGVAEGASVPDTFIPQLFQWYQEGKLPIDKLHKFYEFADINTAVDDLHHGCTIKPILIMD